MCFVCSFVFKQPQMRRIWSITPNDKNIWIWVYSQRWSYEGPVSWRKDVQSWEDYNSNPDMAVCQVSLSQCPWSTWPFFWQRYVTNLFRMLVVMNFHRNLTRANPMYILTRVSSFTRQFKLLTRKTSLIKHWNRVEISTRRGAHVQYNTPEVLITVGHGKQQF